MIAVVKPKKIAIYINSAYKTMAQVKAETGCTHIVNGGLFEGTKACCQLKSDGKVYADDGYKYWGYAWDNASDFGMTVVPCAKKNYIACVDLLRDGKAGDMNYNSQIGGSRWRTAIGTTADGRLVLYCIHSGRTPEQLQKEMEKAGCVDAVMLDGGASSQGDFDGWKITATRIVHNFICVWADNGDSSGEKGDGDSVATLKRGSSGIAVKNLQNQLIMCGAKITADGDFGGKTDEAVKSFQKDMGLSADGVVGKQTFAALDMAVTWKTSGNALVLKAGQYLGVSEPDGDNNIIDAFNDLAGSSFGHTDSWCQMFAVVCMADAKLNPYISASCTLAYNHYKAIGAAQTLPKVGYLIYFDWDSSGDCDHVGIVSAVGGGYVYVIEGNSGGNGYDAVRMKRYLATDTRIRGYADPTAEEAPAYYIVKLPRAAAEKLAKDYGGEVIKYNG